ncbi:MAG: NifB/NifX family molybdenum-iron cluster-binding protein [Candidatus Omnitrophica bacterium]|nr:NifB/NifX family molybdenum-iron cluster-binding protein [Candidatus Omnitrophota bacterium]MDD5237654.1 NifB/NifX family molybdenum-iron cluster-binding protein [Candidatus Omnitrophota bacterium]
MGKKGIAIKEEGVNMKICITSEGRTLDSKVDSRFGRCQNFIFFDTDTGKFEAQENTNAQFQGGAGIQSGQLVVSRGVKAVLTGNVGPNAYQVLSAAGVSVFTGVSGTVQEAIEGYRNSKHKAADSPSVGSKFGMPVKNS